MVAVLLARRLALAGLIFTVGCATLPISPSLTALLQLQMRERAGVYPGSWDIVGDSHKAQLTKLEAWAEAQGIVIAPAPISQKNLLGHVQYSSLAGWVVLINRDLPVNNRLYTLLHELGHVYGPRKLSAEAGEVVAEMTAAQACERLGLNVWPQTTAYLANKVGLETQAYAVQLYGEQIDRVVAKLTAAAK